MKSRTEVAFDRPIAPHLAGSKSATIVLVEICRSIPVTIESISDEGACLQYAIDVAIFKIPPLPEEFEVLFNEKDLIYPVRRKWLSRTQVGITFIGEPRKL